MLVSDTRRRQHLVAVAEKYRPEIFIETGTSEGHTVATMIGHVPRIVSIELGHDKYIHSSREFLNDPTVKLIFGDSDLVLEQVVQLVPERKAMFWLDAHDNGNRLGYADSGGPSAPVPVVRELTYIFTHRRSGFEN